MSDQPTDGRLTILAGHRNAGKCHHCRRAVIWVTSAPHGKSIPFDAEPLVLEHKTNPVTLVRFEVVARTRIHFATCPAQRAQPRHIPTGRNRDAHGRSLR